MLNLDTIYQSRSFARLQVHMKDKDAIAVCVAVMVLNLWEQFERMMVSWPDEYDQDDGGPAGDAQTTLATLFPPDDMGVDD